MQEEVMAKRKVTYKQLNIRMPDNLHKQVVAEAKKNGWPVNRELVRRLEKSFADDVLREATQSLPEEIARRIETRLMKWAEEGERIAARVKRETSND
jgi:hypothetical protein